VGNTFVCSVAARPDESWRIEPADGLLRVTKTNCSERAFVTDRFSMAEGGSRLDGENPVSAGCSTFQLTRCVRFGFDSVGANGASFAIEPLRPVALNCTRLDKPRSVFESANCSRSRTPKRVSATPLRSQGANFGATSAIRLRAPATGGVGRSGWQPPNRQNYPRVQNCGDRPNS
jgi:hypothetical protein